MKGGGGATLGSVTVTVVVVVVMVELDDWLVGAAVSVLFFVSVASFKKEHEIND